jgi:hypothetical protein
MPLSQAIGQMVVPDRGIIGREIFVDRDLY